MAKEYYDGCSHGRIITQASPGPATWPLWTSNKNDNTRLACNFITHHKIDAILSPTSAAAHTTRSLASREAIYHFITRGSSVIKGNSKIMFNVRHQWGIFAIVQPESQPCLPLVCVMARAVVLPLRISHRVIQPQWMADLARLSKCWNRWRWFRMESKHTQPGPTPNL